MADLSVSYRQALAARGKRLEYFTVAWNSLEGLIAILAGAFAGSISLVGFGVDSMIEVASGGALLWRMAVETDFQRRERIELITLRIVGACFVLLAAYLSYEAAISLLRREAPERSLVGIALAVASLIVMPILTRAKGRVGSELGSAAMKADAKQTEFCAYLSAILLGGLLLNASFGWWWADPGAAIMMVPIIAKEGIESLRGHPCSH